MSALSAQAFHRDVQRRISASTHSGPTYYLRGYEAVTPEQKRALEQYNREIEQLRQDAQRLQQLRKDPVLMRHVNGYWQHYKARQPASPGEFCAATYTNLHGSITLSGVDKSWEGGLLTFIGKNIPQPDRFREISATLSQSGGSPSTVRIFNAQTTPAMRGYGTLTFAVPSMNAALAGMPDQQEFAVSIEGKEVFRMSWKDGSGARDTLRTCMRRG
ncbi:hypothetical protein [Polaromonas sp.]|uniref:hypothetical protein n=1 Tax=Polaromonas sp. TaxID=1869339 RepID=UPI002D770CE1|nr:hypothetical protein [Polaromonas sp.]